jgi:hypothetical protein
MFTELREVLIILNYASTEPLIHRDLHQTIIHVRIAITAEKPQNYHHRQPKT